MADIRPFPTARTAKQQAGEWIARLTAEDATAEDRARCEAWRRADPRNAQAFENQWRTWRRYLAAGKLARAVVPDESTSPVAHRARLRRWTLALATAAGVVAVTLLTGFYLWWSAPPTVFNTAVGEQLAVRLPDGSLMELNSESSARVEYSSRGRLIHLRRGEAFFKVAHDASRPFSVIARGHWVRDVGTEFDVYLRAASLQVTVREGTVRAGESRSLLRAAQPSASTLPAGITLIGGEQADLRADSARKRTLSPEDLAEAVAWRTGTLHFEERPLGEVVAELNRYSVAQLVIEDDALRTVRVGGTFQANPQGAAALLRMLAKNFNIQVRRDGTRTYLSMPAHPPAR